MKKLFLILLCLLSLNGCEKTTQETPQNQDQTTLENATSFTPPIEELKPMPEHLKKKVKVSKFFDFGCAYCRQGSKTMKALQAKYGDQVDIQFMHFLIHPQVTDVHKVAACVGEQGKFSDFTYKYFESYYGTVDKKALRKIAQDLPTEMGAYDECMKKNISPIVETHKNLGTLLGVRGTPFFMINDKIPVRGAASFDDFVAIIDGLLAQ
ncbi:MAG TPA: DsbA family protein [Candidatus Gracilibacteria bacterium]